MTTVKFDNLTTEIKIKNTKPYIMHVCRHAWKAEPKRYCLVNYHNNAFMLADNHGVIPEDGDVFWTDRKGEICQIIKANKDVEEIEVFIG